MQFEEKIASNYLGVSFIGFREDLVIPFIQKAINDGANSFLFIESSDKPLNSIRISDEIKNKVIDLLYLKQIPYELVQIINIWDIKEYLKILSDRNVKMAINISAGPSIFSSAATLFSLFNEAIIYHNIQQYNGTSFFVIMDLVPLKNFLGLKLDVIDNLIFKAVYSGATTRSSITSYILKSYGKISERAISYRVKDISMKKILIESNNKPIHYKLDKLVEYFIRSKL